MKSRASICEQVEEALMSGDPLSDRLEQHVATCVGCTREAQLSKALVSAHSVHSRAPKMAMDSALAALALQPLSPTPQWSTGRKLAHCVALCLPAIAIAATVLHRHNFSQITPTHRWLPVVSMAFTLVLGLALTVARGSAGLGVPHGYRWPLAVGTVCFFVAMTLGVSDWHAVENTGFPHVGCILIGGLVSTLGVYAIVRVLKHSDFVAPTQGGALIGIAVASSAIIALHLLCSVTALPHLLFAHGLSFIVAGAVGAHAGRKWLA
jgi:hypothetical protein